MSSVVPLQLYPWPVAGEHMAVLKEAKASLGLEVQVIPTQAVPGLHGRVLGLGSLPPWVCDAALVKRPDEVESVARALKWILTAPPESDRGFMVADYLEGFFGAGVVEVAPPKCKCEGCGAAMAVENYQPRHGHCRGCYYSGCHLAKGLCLND